MTQNPELRGYRIGCSLLVLVVCILAAGTLIALRPDAESRPPQEPILKAELIPAQAEDVTVVVTTHGVARPVRTVTLSSEVAGRVIHMPKRLDAGDLVEEGQLLFKIDPVDYEAAVREAEASLTRLKASLKRLDATETTTRAQLEVNQRSRDLAEADFKRLTTLSREGNAVSQAVAEAADRTLAQAEVQVLQLEQTLELLPTQRAETESEIAAAGARLEQTKTQLSRTTFTAPFTGRVVSSMVEADAYLTPGKPVLELADDQHLEIQIPVQASELRRWVPFADAPVEKGWFPPLDPIEVRIEWTGSERGYQWTGVLDRVISFDATTRTAMLAIRVSGADLLATEGAFPLTDGMFCRVQIPGRTLEQIYVLPREAVTFDNKVYLSENGRLRTVDVTVAWRTEDEVYVSEGIREGDLVVGTRLVAPLEGVRLQDLEEDS